MPLADVILIVPNIILVFLSSKVLTAFPTIFLFIDWKEKSSEMVRPPCTKICAL